MDNFEFILNNHFIVRHCTARKGNDTPVAFHCPKGLRKWSRFFYLDNGEIRFLSITGKEFVMKAGDLLFLPYDIEYSSSWINAKNGLYYSVEFILEFPNGENLNLYDDLMLFENVGENFKNLFYEASEIVSKYSFAFSLKCQEYLMRLLYNVAVFAKIKATKELDIQPAVMLIEGNLRKKISIKELADKCCMSTATFHRKFLKYAGMSPIKYRNSLRMKKAKELLLTGIYTVSEVAEMSGIEDICYFSKLYKQYFGISPSCDFEKE